ncbi:MAG: hypothetical protein ACK5D5_11010 [Bacteroidota bacterium]|jgi:hypothetical protein
MAELTEYEKKLITLIAETISFEIYVIENGEIEKDKLAYSTCLNDKEKNHYTKQTIKKLQASFKKCLPQVAPYISAFINVYPFDNRSLDESKETIIRNFFLTEYSEVFDFIVEEQPKGIEDSFSIDIEYYINKLDFDVSILKDFIIHFANAGRYIGFTSILDTIKAEAPETLNNISKQIENFKELAESTSMQLVKEKLDGILTPKSDLKAIDSAIEKIHSEYYNKFNSIRTDIISKLDVLKSKSKEEYLKGITSVYDNFIKLYYEDKFNCTESFFNIHEDRHKHTDFYCILGIHVLMRKIVKEIVDEILIERILDFDRAYNLPSNFKDLQNYINKGLYEIELLLDDKIKKATYYNIPRAIEKFNSLRFKYENNPIRSYAQFENYHTAINILYEKIDKAEFKNENAYEDAAFNQMWDQLCFFATDMTLLFTQSEIEESEPEEPKIMELLADDVHETQIVKPALVTNKNISKHNSFSYKKTGASSQTKITEFRKDLIDAGLIDKSTKLADFNKIFKNETPSNPIKWSGSISELCYLIKQIHNEKRLVENTDKEVWKITANCFVQSDGTEFIWSKLRGQKKPANTNKLDKIISNL